MTLDACAEIVAKGDPDRWSAVLAAPVPARAILIPIYAANLEIARAPFAATEPMIAEMRLQWWVDALTEIAGRKPVRQHEVTTPLADVVSPDAARDLIRGADARRRDAWNTAFETTQDLETYLAETGGALMACTARALDVPDISAHETIGTASALANLLIAKSDLAARGRDLTRDIEAGALSDLAAKLLTDLRGLRLRTPATLASHLAPAVLVRAARDPSSISEGHLAPSEFRRRLSLLGAVFSMR